jgi:hypothetical protein
MTVRGTWPLAVRGRAGRHRHVHCGPNGHGSRRVDTPRHSAPGIAGDGRWSGCQRTSGVPCPVVGSSTNGVTSRSWIYCLLKGRPMDGRRAMVAALTPRQQSDLAATQAQVSAIAAQVAAAQAQLATEQKELTGLATGTPNQ